VLRMAEPVENKPLVSLEALTSMLRSAAEVHAFFTTMLSNGEYEHVRKAMACVSTSCGGNAAFKNCL
jgi:hypothetical protein